MNVPRKRRFPREPIIKPDVPPWLYRDNYAQWSQVVEGTRTFTPFTGAPSMTNPLTTHWPDGTVTIAPH